MSGAVNVDVEALSDLMSDISENHYCAGWMEGTEFALWEAVTGGSRSWGMGEISQAEIDRMKELSDRIGGWVTHEGFVPIADWLVAVATEKKRIAEWQANRDAELMARPYFNREALAERARIRAERKAAHERASAEWDAAEAATQKWEHHACRVCNFALNARTFDEALAMEEEHVRTEHPWTEAYYAVPDSFSIRAEEREDERMLELLDQAGKP